MLTIFKIESYVLGQVDLQLCLKETIADRKCSLLTASLHDRSLCCYAVCQLFDSRISILREHSQILDKIRRLRCNSFTYFSAA